MPARGDGLTIEVEPPLQADRARRLFRARIDGVEGSAEPWLFRGTLSSYQERALRGAEISAALRERAVPLRYWRNAGALWVQPLEHLEADADYQLALTGRGAVQDFKTVAGQSPTVERLFPPAGGVLGQFSVLCGVPEASQLPDLTLEPGHISVAVSNGVLGAERAGCVTLEVTAPLHSAAVLPPELNGIVSDPSPFVPQPEEVPDPPPCTTGAAVAHSCVEAEDDHLRVTASLDSLWLLNEPEANIVVAKAGVRTRLSQGLAPRSNVLLAGLLLEPFEAPREVRLSLTTAPPRRHLVLNEVLANPKGAEPKSEWIELINDAETSTTLDGVWLEDGGGSVPLPPEQLAPHEIVLLASQASPSAGPDVPAPESVRVIVLPMLGTRGLANGGEALLLVDQEGVISRFPALAAKEAGRSLARREPGSADDAPENFALHGAPGASPGTPNRFDD